jgi:hypothetical protein
MNSLAHNEVKVGDILIIISNTRASTYNEFMTKIVDNYLSFIPASERIRIRKVVSFLYKTGRIHQHRMFNDPSPSALVPGLDVNQEELDAIGEENLSISPLEQPDILRGDTWMHVVPTNQNTTPAVVAAYEHYKLLDALTKS